MKCELASSVSGYVKEAGCSANAKELSSSEIGLEQFHLMKSTVTYTVICGTLNDL